MSIVESQIDYYRARAAEYDEWFFRKGRYELAPEIKAKWDAEVAEVRAAIDALAPAGPALELAPGTGNWSQQLVQVASSLHAVDAAPEMIDLARAKTGDATNAVWELADIFKWRPDRRYDLVFTGFFLSHVPPDRLAATVEMIAECLRPGGRFFFVDSQNVPESGAPDHKEPGGGLAARILNDGRQFTIVKVFYEPHEIERLFARVGIDLHARLTSNFFIYGKGTKAEERP